MFRLFLLALCISNVFSALNFLAIGDWGGQDDEPFYTTGQIASVKGMDKIASANPIQFVLAVGDNFYESGIRKGGVESPRFQTTFENVYSPSSLQVDFYAIAGNHDHMGNVSAQIDYTSRSKRWKFPDIHHVHNFVDDDGTTLDLVMIDTTAIASIINKHENEEGYFDPLPELPKSFNQKAWDWIEAQLKASTADYIFVVGHYPLYSVCQHGNTRTLITHLRPLLLQYGAHNLAGHDHCMEYMAEPDSNNHYFLTGMGTECCYSPKQKALVPEEILKWYIAGDNKGDVQAGFTGFSLTKESMTATFYDQDGNALFTSPAIPPRTAQQKNQQA